MLTGIVFGKVLGPMIRHSATAVGAWLVAEGHADADTAQQITGGIVAATTLAISLIDKRFF